MRLHSHPEVMKVLSYMKPVTLHAKSSDTKSPYPNVFDINKKTLELLFNPESVINSFTRYIIFVDSTITLLMQCCTQYKTRRVGNRMDSRYDIGYTYYSIIYLHVIIVIIIRFCRIIVLIFKNINLICTFWFQLVLQHNKSLNRC